jgi:hypothetical protein
MLSPVNSVEQLKMIKQTIASGSNEDLDNKPPRRRREPSGVTSSVSFESTDIPENNLLASRSAKIDSGSSTREDLSSPKRHIGIRLPPSGENRALDKINVINSAASLDISRESSPYDHSRNNPQRLKLSPRTSGSTHASAYNPTVSLFPAPLNDPPVHEPSSGSITSPRRFLLVSDQGDNTKKSSKLTFH